MTIPVACVRAPWWRRLLARWRARRELPSPTVEIRIPEYAGGGSVHVLANETPYLEHYERPAPTAMPGPLQKRLG